MTKVPVRYKVGGWFFGSELDKQYKLAGSTENKIAKDEELKVQRKIK